MPPKLPGRQGKVLFDTAYFYDAQKICPCGEKDRNFIKALKDKLLGEVKAMFRA